MTTIKPNIDIRKVTVIPRDQWERIKSKLEPRSQDDMRLLHKIQDRERLHQKSIEVVKNWPNTIQGQRQRKLEARKLRLEKEELELQRIDQEEAKFQQARRREAIDQAKTLQYYQTDRVKNFHGAMLLSEVLKERDAQVTMKKQIQEMKKQREAEEDSVTYTFFDDQSKARAESHKAKTLEVANYQRRQRQMKQDNLRKEILEEIELGQSLREADQSHKNWVTKKLEKEGRYKKQLMFDVIDQIEQKRRAKEYEKMQNQEEDKEIKIFDEAKHKLQKERKRRDLEIKLSKQRTRERMMHELNAVIEGKQRREDELIAHVVQQRDNEEAEIAKLKNAKTKAALESIQSHRNEQRNRHLESTNKQKEKDQLDLINRIEIDNEYHKTELLRKQEKEAARKELAEIHLKQVNDRATTERKQIDQEIECNLAQLAATRQEETEFKEYADEVIKRAKTRNANIYPLLKASKPGDGGGHGPINSVGTRPSFMSCDGHGVQLPTYQKDSTESIKKHYSPQDITHAKKRFGFVW